MARFKNGIIGEINGRVGNLVIRKMNRQNFISLRPRSYNKSSNPKANSIRTRFAMQTKLASFINSQPLLSETWRQLPLNSISAYHKILKTNLAVETNEILSTKHNIVPSSSLEIISKLTFENCALIVTLKNCSVLKDESDSLICKLYIIIVLNESGVPYNPQPRFFYFVVPLNILQIRRSAITVPILSNGMLLNQSREKKLIVYASVIWNQTNTTTLNWCKTYSQELFF